MSGCPVEGMNGFQDPCKGWLGWGRRGGQVAIVCRQAGGLVEAGILQIRYSAGMKYRPEDSAIKVCSRILLHPLEKKECILNPTLENI